MTDASLSDTERAEYQAEVALWHGRAEALAEASNMWRAHAEALAGALQECQAYFGPWDQREPECTEDAMARTIACALACLPADALAERSASCPCAYGEPCHPDCTCACPVSSKGCLRCCSYGNRDQRQAAAARLVAERRALENCAFVLRVWGTFETHGTTPIEATKAALAALDAARREGGA